MKNTRNLKNVLFFLVIKFSVYLNRLVYVMMLIVLQEIANKKLTVYCENLISVWYQKRLQCEVNY